MIQDASRAATAGAPPPFPLNTLPGPLRAFVVEASDGLPCPPDLLGVPAIVVMGAALGNARALEVRPGWREQPLIYAAIVADSGSRKSPALALATRPIDLRERELAAAYEAEAEAHRTGLAAYEVNVALWKEEMKRAAAGKGDDPGSMPGAPEEPIFRQVSTSDATIEALCQLLAQNPRGLVVVKDELAGWARGMNQYRRGLGADRQTWLSMWSGNRVTINRKGERGPTTIEAPFASVVGCLPPDVLGELSDERGREDGFVHRILFAYPDPVALRWTERTISDSTLAAYVELYEQLAALRPGLDNEAEIVGFTPRGRAAFVDWLESHYAELHEVEDRLRGPWAKLEGYGARLALIMHEMRFVSGEARSEDVDEVSVQAATDLVTYFKGHAERVYLRLHSNPRDRQVEAVLAWLRRKHLMRTTARDLRRAKVAGIATPSDAEEVLQELADRGYGAVERPGRDSIRFTISNALASRQVVASLDPLRHPPLPEEVDAAPTWQRHGDRATDTRNSSTSSDPGELASGKTPKTTGLGSASRPEPTSGWSTLEQRIGAGELPVPGDGGYLEWLDFRRDALTAAESRRANLLHLTLFRALAPIDPRGEDGLLADLEDLLDATPVVPESPCRYPSHRAAGDWRDHDGRLRCRVCHPPVPGAEQ